MFKSKSKQNVDYSSLNLDEKRYGRILGFIILVLATLVICIYYYYSHKSLHKELLIEQNNELESIEKAIQNEMQLVVSPLLIMSRSESALSIFTDPASQKKIIMNDIFLSIIQELKIYQQIRLLNEVGMEVVRVDRTSDGNYKVIEDQDLQNKSDRYYYSDILNTPTDTIYLSPFDLNVEHEEIEIPYNPMIRIGKTYESEEHKIKGMMVLNVHGQILLDVIKELNIHQEDQVFLLNNDGYYLYSEDKNKNFAFMFDNMMDVGFFNDHKEAWNGITQNKTMMSNSFGNYYIRTIQLIDGKYYKSTQEKYHIVMFVPYSKIHDKDIQLNLNILLLSIIVLPLLYFGGQYIGILVKRNQLFKYQLEQSAFHDSLTGLYNHRMIVDLLSKMMGHARRNNEILTVVFADINNLKYVNDSFGHKMGDKMIISAAKSILHSIRHSDLPARIGGDEFLIILPNCAKDDAKIIMERVSEMLKKAGVDEMNTPWYLSYGCTELLESDSVNDFISRADNLMYIHKKSIKEELGSQNK